jgi:hypothetical protein
MPEISRFYGIRITMYVGMREHPPPPFHAEYGSQEALFRIPSGELLEGSLPKHAIAHIQEWCDLHSAELEQNWRLARNEQSLNRIDPL